MESYEVLRQAADGIGVKALAAELRLSSAMVYKWCQESNRDDPDASGARNPLDRLADIVRVTGSTDVVNWLCHQAGGFFVENPDLPGESLNLEMLTETQKLVEEFSRLLSTVTRSIEDDGFIEKDESKHIRQSWEQLKSSAEKFSVACEQGVYSANSNSRQEP